MATTGLQVWDKTVQTTNIWLDEIMDAIGPDRQFAWHVLGAVLRTLRDRLPIEIAVHLGAQLPLLVRGAYYEQWHVGGEHPTGRGMEEFLGRVAASLGDTRSVAPAEATAAVFATLARHVDPGQVAKVLSALPEGIRRPLRDATAL
ncbi:DUF2267 domain-containing protein [Falsiroseomonas tokyonensis]|uniref:DUF2267 domain-containing protein n=1 Tax=Falsiroseomonas tokyonensis TaxID=430521 RepID=A0ABV7C1R6_9PROT|nr:DUF2267 domain-containing protein [Falsiroseomonas tokyonensis]MBU8541414.1 DUF2267 domain-containing protein [Falsiroseomonas tokyonensis]